MSRNLFAGSTDYSYQSIDEIIQDMKDWVKSIKKTLYLFEQTIKELKKSDYWNSKVPSNFKILISQSLRFYKTSLQELTDILKNLDIEIRQDHVKRLNVLGVSAIELNLQYGIIWHQQYPDQEYGNKNFELIENLYGEGRDTIIDMTDLNNLSHRLKDFVGKKSKNPNKLRNLLNNKWVYGIGTLIIGSLILFYVFGIGKSSESQVDQSHSGSGDTVAGDKVIKYGDGTTYNEINLSDNASVGNIFQDVENLEFVEKKQINYTKQWTILEYQFGNGSWEELYNIKYILPNDKIAFLPKMEGNKKYIIGYANEDCSEIHVSEAYQITEDFDEEDVCFIKRLPCGSLEEKLEELGISHGLRGEGKDEEGLQYIHYWSTDKSLKNPRECIKAKEGNEEIYDPVNF